jgi:broad specificity phosphatase PhoE
VRRTGRPAAAVALAPGATCTVHLLRHAEVHNPDGILYARAPGFLLSDAGEEMAATVAERLRRRDVVAVWSSPMERALQTAAHVARTHNLPVWEDDRLTEASSRLEGTRASVDRPVLLQPRVWTSLWNPWKPSWGEPYAEVLARMREAVVAAASEDEAQGREVVLVSHQMPIWVLRRHAEGRRSAHHPARRACALASTTTLRIVDGRVAEVTYDPGPGARVAGGPVTGTTAGGPTPGR